ncbi:MAG: prephenate dehydrogenase [Thermodesulfovibrionales bacterium]
MTTKFDKITVLGVGQIGASFALAIRNKGLCRHIAGSGRHENNLLRAKEMGIIDSYDLDPAAACTASELVLLSAPVGAFPDLVRRCSASLKRGAIITDAGSVKGSLVRDIERLLPAHVRYIGGHPIAGSDRSGIDSSSADLFKNAKCIVTPTENSDAAALNIVTDIWKSLGSQVITMDPAAHDRIYGAVSHLPHVIAYALMNTVSDIDPAYLEFCGQGFKDTTRIASSSPEMWRDICLFNRENLIEMLLVFQKKLELFGRYLEASDSVSIEKEFKKARDLRDGIGQG